MTFSMRGTFREVDLGAWKPGELTSMTVAGALTYYKVTIDGEDVVEIDILNVVRIINGVDQLAGLRDAIGL